MEARAAEGRNMNSRHRVLLIPQVLNYSVVLAATGESNKLCYTLKDVCSKASWRSKRNLTLQHFSLASVMHARAVFSRPSKFLLAGGI